MLSEFTTTDEVRAVLGVAESELPDTVIELPLYARTLEFDLADLSSTITADYRALPDIDTRTSEQELFFNCLQVFSAYAVARSLVTNAAMFAPKVITDSKTTLQRENPYEKAAEAVQAGFLLMRSRLLAAYAVLAPTAAVASTSTFTPMLGVGIAADPVTGE